MLAQRKLTKLQESKRALLVRSDMHRAVIRSEYEDTRARLAWMHEAKSKLHSASPWIAAGAGVVGLLAARRVGGLSRWIPIGLGAWRFVKKLRTN